MKSTMKLVGIIVAIIVVIIGGTFLTGIAKSNGAIRRESTVETAKADLSAQEKRREDLVYNLADCVQAYDTHEYETIIGYAEARETDSTTGAMTDETVTETINQIKAVAESVPTLQSSANYQQFMTELSTTENMIFQYRTAYNQTVKKYNNFVKTTPNKQLLSLVGYEVMEYEALTFDTSADAPTNLFE